MGFDTATIMGGLYGEGIIGLKGAFDRDWVERLGEDAGALFEEARARPGGVVKRWPSRYHVPAYPERIRGFVEFVTHPWVAAVNEAVLGPDYRIVDLGFDVPLPGAEDEPWHRDLAAPEDTLVGRRLSSLAFDVTTVDVFDHMGPMEIAPGTQWDDPTSFERGVLPPKDLWGRLRARAQRRLPMMGDVIARSALTIHRGTANRSGKAGPMLVLAVVAPSARPADRPGLRLTRGYHDALPEDVRRHLACEVVDVLREG